MEKLIGAVVLVFVAFLTAVMIAAGLGLLAAFPIKWLWNYAAVDVLHVARLNFWHAWALSWLCAMLFKTSVKAGSGTD